MALTAWESLGLWGMTCYVWGGIVRLDASYIGGVKDMNMDMNMGMVALLTVLVSEAYYKG